MLSNRFAMVAVAVACIGAAGTGGYLATRHNVTEIAAPDAAAAAQEPQPVQETEALVSAEAKPSVVPAEESRPAASPTVAVARRPEPAASRAQSSRPSASTPKPSQPPVLQRSWPSNTPAQAPAAAATSAADQTQPVAHSEERAQELPRTPEPPVKNYAELVVPADSVVGLRTDSAVSSEKSRVEDRVEAHVVRDVRVNGEVANPAGSRVEGTVVTVDRGGKFKERARLGIRFQTLVLADGTRLPITTETIYRYGNPPGNTSAAKIGGGAVVGAIIGGIIGGGKGAAIGATTGAGAGTASVMTSDRDVAVFPSGTEVTARVLSPVAVTVERE